MPNIEAGSEYYIADNGWGDQHLNGKRVTALTKGGGWGSDYVDVRCHCCGKLFEHVGVDKLS